jgi:hypothetical protein
MTGCVLNNVELSGSATLQLTKYITLASGTFLNVLGFTIEVPVLHPKMKREYHPFSALSDGGTLLHEQAEFI